MGLGMDGSWVFGATVSMVDEYKLKTSMSFKKRKQLQ